VVLLRVTPRWRRLHWPDPLYMDRSIRLREPGQGESEVGGLCVCRLLPILPQRRL